MKFTVQPTFPGCRRNSPRAATLCSDLGGLTALPAALFVADEAGITVTIDGDSEYEVRALIGARFGSGDEFSDKVLLITTLPGLGTVECAYAVKLGGTVGGAINNCAIAFAVSIAEAALDAGTTAELVVLDLNDDTLVHATV